MDLNKKAVYIANKADWFVSHPFTVFAFCVSIPISFYLTGVDVTNVYISIVTAMVLFITAAGNRSTTTATQAKLDELIEINPKARNELIRSQEQPADEIERLEPKVP